MAASRGSATLQQESGWVIPKARTTIIALRTDIIARPDLYLAPPSPLTILVAGAGFGKSQLIAHWAKHQFLIGYGLCSRLGETPSSLLELLFAACGKGELYDEKIPWQQQIDLLLEFLYAAPEGLLVLDDVHHLESSTSEVENCRLLLSYLLDYRPPQCRIILSGRCLLALAELEVLKLRGEVSVIGADKLALSVAELEQHYPSLGQRLAKLTSGWPLAVATLVRFPSERWEDEKEALAGNLLRIATAELSPKARRAAAILGLMDWASKDEIADPEVWAELTRLALAGGVVGRLDSERLQLHPLFAEQFKLQASDEVRSLAVKRLFAAGRLWEALELIKDKSELSARLLEYEAQLLSGPRLKLLQQLLERTEACSVLMRLKGDVAWRLGNPALALELFRSSALLAGETGESALEAKAWLAAAELYLDSVCPREADQYLRCAYRALGPGDRREKARVLERFAENAVNQGLGRRARRYRALAAAWDGAVEQDLVVTARILMRSGRLTEARGGLEMALTRLKYRWEQEAVAKGVLEGHRDPRLVLAYIHALEGRPQQSMRLAQEVLEQARELEDRLTEAVALTRFAHSMLIGGNEAMPAAEVLEAYVRAEAMASELGVDRLRVEMLMGQSLYYSLHQLPKLANELACAGIELANRSGDVWMEAWLRLVRAIAAARALATNAIDLLEESRDSFRSCRDRFGYALADAWLGSLDKSYAERRHKAESEFSFLALRPSLFGPPSAKGFSLPKAPLKLQVFCLGMLGLALDGQPISLKAFKRKKARELFVLLIARPDQFMHREELAAELWPEANYKASLRDFRVALHSLSDVLEPDRPKNSLAFCLDRKDERYCIMSEKVDLDSARFEALAASGENEFDWERALKLYRGPFCEDYPYMESINSVRDKYDRIYFQLAEKLSNLYLESERSAMALELAQRVLARDSTWEPAYRLLMRAQASLGHLHLLPRTFSRCLETLEEELGVEPSEETFALARELLGDKLATLL